MDKQSIQALIDTLTKQLRHAPDSTELTIGAWSTDYLSILSDRNYNPQTIKNRRANLKHVVQLWGEYTFHTLKPYQIDVQTLLGHKHAVMTDLYKDDRGLTAHIYKQVGLASHTSGA